MADNVRLTAKDKEQIARIMSGLNCSFEEALEVHLCDKAIDKGEHMDFDLTKEQEKEVRKMIKHESMSGAKYLGARCSFTATTSPSLPSGVIVPKRYPRAFALSILPFARCSITLLKVFDKSAALLSSFLLT